MTRSGPESVSVGVIGLGTMGPASPRSSPATAYRVVGVEATEEALERGRQHVELSTGRALRRGKLSEDEQSELLARITFTTAMVDVLECGLVVEAVVEKLGVKQQIFRQLDDIVAPETVLATNTSSLPVTEISTATSHPGRVIGLHFFNPAPVQNLVEIIRTVVTEPEVLDRTAELARSLDKTPGIVGTRPASSRTPCSSATSTTPRRCSRAGARPVRTSTPRCATAAATPWARWPCSTSSAWTRWTRSWTRCTARAASASMRPRRSSSRW